MLKMQKVAAVIVAITSLLTAAVMPAGASAAVTYKANTIVHSGPLAQGDTVTVSLSVTSSTPLSMVQASLWYDPALFEAVEGTASEFLSNSFSFPTVNTAPIDPQTGEIIEGKVNVGAMSMSAVTVAPETVIATVVLRARLTITEDTVFTVSDVSASDASMKKLTCEAINGKMSILMGDVDADCGVTITDVLKVVQALNGIQDLTQDEARIADLNLDGKVTLFDAVRLFYIVNGMI